MGRCLAVLLSAVVLGVVQGGGPASSAQSVSISSDAGFVCPPCGCPYDDSTLAQAGNCPGCGMALIARAGIRDVAILIYEGVGVLDFTGPMETFAAAFGHFRVHTVARTLAPVSTTLTPLNITPDYQFDNCPGADILVVPGGGVGGALRDSVTLDFVRRTAGEAQIVLSVCSGAFILAKAGLLDGLEATTHPDDLDEFRRLHPGVHAVEGRPYVDNGKFIAAGGVLAGIEAALHIIERLHGRGQAGASAQFLQHPYSRD